MRWALCFLFLSATPALAQDEPSFLERLFGTDTAESDAEQGSLLEQLIEDSLSGTGRTVSVTGFRGALSGQATLDSLTISDEDGTWFTLTDATLDWNRAALFAGRLEVTEISAAEILLPRLGTSDDASAPTPEAGSFQLPDLPVSVEIGRIAAQRVALGQEVIGVEAQLSLNGSVSLSGGEGAAKLDVTRLDQPGTIALDAGYDNTTQNLRLDLSMSEGEGGIVATLASLPGAPSVDFAVTGNAPLSDFAADIRLATDGEDRITGRVMLGETETARRISAELRGDIAPVFTPQYRDFFGDSLTLDAEALAFADGRFSLTEFSLFANELALFGTLDLGADRLPERIDITGRIAPETGETVLLPFADGDTRIGRANLAVQFDAARADDWRGVIRMERFQNASLAADEVMLRATGLISGGTQSAVSGVVDFDMTGLEASSEIESAIGSTVEGSARITWAGGPVEIENFSVDAKDLAASGNAVLEVDELQVEAALNMARIANFSGMAGRPLGGQADLSVAARINPLTQAFTASASGSTRDLTVNDPRADAVLAGTARLVLEAQRDTDGLRIDLQTLESDAADLTGQANLRSGGSSVALRGRLNQTSLVVPGVSGPSNIALTGQEDDARDWTVTADLDAPSLAAKVAGLLSNIYALPAFQGTLDANAPDISIFSEAAGRALAGQLSVQAEGGTNADLSRALIDAELSGADIVIGGLGTDRLLQGPVTLALRGSRTEDRIDIETASFEGQALVAQIAGVLTGLTEIPKFDGTVRAESADLSVFSTLAQRSLGGQLAVDVEGHATADLAEFKIDGTANGQDIAIGIPDADRLFRGPVDIQVDAARSEGRIAVSNVVVRTASLTAETSGHVGNNGERLTINARLNDVSPYLPGFSGALSAMGTVGLSGDDFALAIDATGPGGSRTELRGTVAQNAATADVTATGTAPLALANRFIAPRSLAGTSSFNLRLAGPPALGNVSGQIDLTDGRLAAPTLRTALEAISGRIELAQGRATLSLDARAESGGNVNVTGPVDLTTPNTAALRLRLANLRLTDPKLYETTADGEVRIDGPLAGGATIAGTINLGETNVQIPSSGLGGAGAIPEITHLNEPPPVRGTRRKAGLLEQDSNGGNGRDVVYPLNLQILAPNRIFVRGRGLDSEFGGAIRITGTTANVIPIGAFELIRGRLDILGRRLDLEEARITIQGGLIPFLNIRASTEAEDTEVNVEVIGPADSPEIRFTSSPELPQEEVLARLIFGRGLETLSPLQAARLAIAVRTLAGRGGEGIVGNIRGQAGLADLDVTTNEDGNAAVRAGAYLGENIYSDVTVDSEGETQLNLNLDVTPSLTVRGGVTNDGSSSLGIFFERDY